MDRTIGKSQNRNYDGERLMKILKSYKRMMMEFINEADVDDEKIIKYKTKDGEPGEMKAGSAKTMPKDHPAKISYDKMQGDGGDDSEKDSGGKLGGGDFDRDGDDDADDMDRDARFDADDEDDEKNASEKENEKIENELNSIAKDRGLTVGSEEANHGGEIHNLIGKDDDPDNYVGFHAAPNYDNDGNMTDGAQYAIELGAGNAPIYFDSKEEGDEALKKVLDDEQIKKAMNGEGDKTVFDLKGDIESLLKGKEDKPESELDALDKKIKDTEAKMNMAGSNYGDPQQQELAGELFQDLEKLKAKREKLAGGSDKNETKVINGVKYKPIKESKKHPLKENYDRIFRSRK